MFFISLNYNNLTLYKVKRFLSDVKKIDKMCKIFLQ